MANVKHQEFPLTFEKGLVAEIEESVLDVGQASELVNWEPATYGGLRVRNAWTSISTTGLPSTYNVRGFGSVAVGGLAAVAAGPQIVQTQVWPNGNQDPLATKTLTLSGCTIGNIAVAVVADDSGNLTPTVTAGWTQRAVDGNTQRQYVKFYTKTIASSTEAFTYTISTFRIRSVTLYEVAYLDAEDPGTKWAADSTLSGGDGTVTISASGTDTDGGLAIIGTLYDGGTPYTAIGGTAGMTSVTDDNANTRTGVTLDDLDNLDSGYIDSDVQTTYTTPSWTPPDNGMLWCVIMRADGSAWGSNEVVGNNLTWTARDAFFDSTTTLSGWKIYTADLSQAGKTTGSITVNTSGMSGGTSWCVMFFRTQGSDVTTPIVQSANRFDSSFAATEIPTSLAALQPGSMVIGLSMAYDGSGVGPQPHVTHSTAAGHFTGIIDTAEGSAHLASFSLAYQDAAGADVSGGNTLYTGASSADGFLALVELGGSGSASKDVHGTFLSSGTVTSQYTYVANKRVTSKLVLWGFVPPEVDATPDQVDFNIVLALADGATTYKIYQIPRDEITSGTWEKIDEITDAQNSSAWVSFAQGAGRLAWTATSMLAPRSIQLNPLVPSNIADMSGLAGRAVVYHKDRLFIGGSNDSPARLYFSQIGEPTEFVTATDFLDIGGDDGESIQDLTSVEGLLLVPKTNRAYLISGSGVESFFVNELAGGTAAAGKPSIRTPYGTILAGNDDVWVVQGGGVDPMSRPLGGGYEVTGNVSTAYAQDMALVADATGGTIWRVNLVTGAWSQEEVGLDGDEASVYMVFSLNGRLYYGVNGGTTHVGGTRRLTSDRNYDDTTEMMSLRASTGRMAMIGPQVRYTPRHLFLQLRNHGDPNTLFVRVETNLGSKDFSYRVTETTQREYESVGWAKGIEWIKVSMWCNVSPEFGAIDVEKAVLTAGTEDY